MLKEDLQAARSEIQSEIDNPNAPAKKVKNTLAYKMIKIAYNLAKFWSAMAALGLLSQIALKLLEKPLELSNTEIPGLGILFGVAGAIVGAVAGGEKITEGLAKVKNGNRPPEGMGQ